MSSKIVSTTLLSNPHKTPPDNNNNNISSSVSFIINSSSQVVRKSRKKSSWALRATAETLYQLLGIAETGSSLWDIKKAYREMARKYHPDVSPPEEAEEYTRRFIMVHEAYETLSDPQTRASYDTYLQAAGLGGIPFSTTKSQMEEKAEWKKRWLSQLDELKQRGNSKISPGFSNARVTKYDDDEEFDT